jgi:hypothetical protein
MELKCRGSTNALIFMPSAEARGEAYYNHQEQVGQSLDSGMVLLQCSAASEPEPRMR